jgi:hypothetical protein
MKKILSLVLLSVLSVLSVVQIQADESIEDKNKIVVPREQVFIENGKMFFEFLNRSYEIECLRTDGENLFVLPQDIKDMVEKKAREYERFYCRLCPASFSSRYYLDRHYNYDH